eukprot:4703353-Amphidinium_carterae.1
MELLMSLHMRQGLDWKPAAVQDLELKLLNCIKNAPALQSHRVGTGKCSPPKHVFAEAHLFVSTDLPHSMPC